MKDNKHFSWLLKAHEFFKRNSFELGLMFYALFLMTEMVILSHVAAYCMLWSIVIIFRKNALSEDQTDTSLNNE